jgi:hypothetical protein
MKCLCLLGVLWVLFVNCNGQKIQKVDIAKAETTKPLSFQMITIPSVLTNPAERAEYLMMHYWDNFDFSDTVYLHLTEITEQAFVDYVDVMPYTSIPVVSASIKNMLKKAETENKVFKYFIDLYEKYLYDPNSPMRNDEFFIPVLEAMLNSPAVEEKTRPAYLLELAKQNRQGEKATDFTYTLAGGRKATLYSIPSDYILMFFYNPDCHNCQEVSEQLQASPAIQYLIRNGKISILAVYPDEDISAWKNYLSRMPKEWINSYDASTRLKDEIYALKAIPTLYLLDKNKVVLLKDPTFEHLEQYLQQQVSQQQ